MADENQAIQREESLYRDTRPFYVRFGQFWQSRQSSYGYWGLGVAALLIPGVGPVLLIIGLTGLLIFLSRTLTLPIHIPITSELSRDPHNPKPGSGRPGPPNGIYYLGNAAHDNMEIWENKDALTGHMAYLATTGGGKTVGLTSMLCNTFIQGGGASYCDGKAQLDVPVRIMSLAHRFGRYHDCFVLNFMQGGRSPWGEQEAKSSHAFSFLTTGSASMVSEILLSLLKVDDDMWGQRARLFLRAIGYIIVYLRDSGLEQPSMANLIKLLNLQTAMEYAVRPDIPESAKGLLKAYLENLPGITPEMIEQSMGGEVPEEVNKQHGFITMQLVPLLLPLQYEYQEQLSPLYPEIDILDCALNNRILITALPSLEKSGESVAALGRVIVAAVKAMMAKSIYTELEGDTAENLDSLPTNADTPYALVWDEAGAYFSEDHAVSFAMARSLNFLEILGTQDLAAMKKLGERAMRATESVMANTNTKLFGRTEDSGETLRFIKERADQAVFSEQTQYSIERGIANAHVEHGVSLVRRDRLTMRKLARLNAGEAYIIWRDQIILAKLFYAQVARIGHLRMPRFVPPPNIDTANSLTPEVRQIAETLKETAQPENELPKIVVPQNIREIIEVLTQPHADLQEAMEKWHESNEAQINKTFSNVQVGEEDRRDDDTGSAGGFGPMAPVTAGYWSNPLYPEALLATDSEAEENPPAGGAETTSVPEERGRYTPYFDLLFRELGESKEAFQASMADLSLQLGGDPKAEQATLRDALRHPESDYDADKAHEYIQLAQQLAELAGNIDTPE